MVSRALTVLTVLAMAGAGNAATPPPSPATLLARHSPIVVLHPSERFTPVPVEGFLADSDVKQKQADGSWAAVQGPLPTSGGPWRLDQRLCNVRDGLLATDCYASAEAAHSAAPAVYGATFRKGRRIALQYWLFYPFDAYSPEVPPNPQFAQVHEGDWEMVTVILDANGKPLTAGYSRHCGGARRDWAKVERRGTHPVVYVALGSHANYFGPGRFPQDKRCWPAVAISIIEQNGKSVVDFVERGRTVRPRVISVSARLPEWMAFPGTWGEDRIVQIIDQKFTFGAGPTGPAFHGIWRNPVAEPLSWPKG